MSAGDHMETVATDTYIVAFKCPYKYRISTEGPLILNTVKFQK